MNICPVTTNGSVYFVSVFVICSFLCCTAHADTPAATGLQIVTTPSNAVVRIGKHRDELGKYVGTTPVEVTLWPGRYRVEIALPNCQTKIIWVDVEEGGMEQMNVALDYHYPRNKFKKLGHFSFWPGAALIGVGFVAREHAQPRQSPLNRYEHTYEINRSKKWTGVMLASWIGGGIAMTTGIVLWVLRPSNKEYYLERNLLGIGPMKNGAAFSFVRRF